jgi:glycosyltransferase involved in cell wall biosynthesis
LIPRFLYSKSVARKLEQLINDKQPDIAHIHFYKGALTPSILTTLKKHNIPAVFTLHDYGLLCPHNLFLDGKRKICTKCLDSNHSLNCLLNKCNRNNLFYSTISTFDYFFHKSFIPFHKYFAQYISVSQFNYNLHTKRNVLKKRLSLLYNFFPELNNIKPQYKRGDYFLYYGRLSKEKGIMTLLKAWAKLNSKFILKIVGDGPQKEEILFFIKEKHLTNIHYIGFKQKNELPEIIKNASFVIVPSEWYENNPLTIVEAYSYGKPVIGSKIGGIPEIVVNGKTGYLFNFGNYEELSTIINQTLSLSENRYIEMAKNAREFAERTFLPEMHYQALVRIYENLANK